METSLKVSTEDFRLELTGSEEFVRASLEPFLPLLRLPAGVESPPTQAAAEPESALKKWFRETVPNGYSPTMQDMILVFAYYLNREKRQFIFVPDDMKASFRRMDRTIPKSLLQILGSLKRDRGLLYSGERRGEYCLTPAGIRHVQALLGISTVESPASPTTAPEPASVEANAGNASPLDRAQSLFQGRTAPDRNEV